MDYLSPVSAINGVGEKTSKLLNNLGVYTIEDILLFFPRAYEVYPEPTLINPDLVNQTICIRGRVKYEPKTIKTRVGMVTSAVLICEGTTVELVWFNAPYIKGNIDPNKTYCFYGKLILDNNRFKMSQPKLFTEDQYEALKGMIQPVYHLTKGLKNVYVKKAVEYALGNCSLRDRLPDYLAAKYNLISYSEALRIYHFPDNYEQLVEARRRLAFEELFFFILNTKLQEDSTVSLPNTFEIGENPKVKEVISELPFSLTKGQEETLKDILSDLRGEYISQRLVQGDVGSGKTMVAFLTMLEVALSGYQSALMAPTEVLARQHYETFLKYTNDFKLNIKVALFLGSMKASEKKEMQRLVDENPDCFIIGTHALISEGRSFNNLAYVITDEQHRFGVRQREKLSLKGDNPHMLVMSATPIPRTLAMILYGNMHVSAIKELPAERLPIKTCVIKESKRNTAYKFIADEVEKGHQAYIICPLVEASETTEASNVTDYSNDLKKHFNGKYNVGMLHGKMKPKEKNEIMDSFARGEIDILVSTTVVEVGVNVPNATVMMIENANRFGLAALHQLRGRVGRGSAQSYCILMSTANKKRDDERLGVMLKSNDGFYIAKEDLRLRGPGDFFGVRQSGEFSFRVADIYNDADDLSRVAEEVDNLLKDDPKLLKHEELLKDLNLFLANQSYVL